MIKQINTYLLQCAKHSWSSEDRFLASCLDIQEQDNYHIVDVRIVSKKALRYYLSKVFPGIMLSPSNASYRKALFQNIKVMYNRVYSDFINGPYKKAGYVESVNKDLRDYQKEVLAYSMNRKNNLWALEQGLGKTLTAATLSKITSSRRTIIICPSLVKYNWYEDMTRFWGYNPMFWTIIDAKKSKTIKAFRERFVVLNFEQVAKNMDYLLNDEVNHIIIDECHFLKNNSSSRSKAVAKLIKESNDPRLTMLSGTPVTNRIVDMFNYLKMADHPLGQNFSYFKEQYTISVGRGDKVIGAKNLPDLKGKISNIMIRLKSEDCLDLPPKIMKNYYFQPGDILGEYQQALNELKEKKERYEELHGKNKQKMFYKIRANIHTMNRIVATSKVPKIKELVDTLIEQGEKVAVFSGYQDPLNLLEENYGSSCVKINSTVDSHKRMQLVNRFNEDDSCNVFLGGMKSAGIGVNLVSARYVIFTNFPFTPDDIEQAFKRLHRSGQKRKVYILNTLALGTIDEHIYGLVSEKAEDINKLVDGNHQATINYSNIEGELFNKLLE